MLFQHIGRAFGQRFNCSQAQPSVPQAPAFLCDELLDAPGERAAEALHVVLGANVRLASAQPSQKVLLVPLLVEAPLDR